MDELLKKLPYWSTLNDTEKRTVKGLAIVNHYESGNTLHGNCDKGVSCLRMIYVISGELRAYILSEEGREIINQKIKSFGKLAPIVFIFLEFIEN